MKDTCEGYGLSEKECGAIRIRRTKSPKVRGNVWDKAV